jgi:hypothetical protein
VSCIHHWIIDPATGPTSPGVCLKCGKSKTFSNHLEVKRVHGMMQYVAPERKRIMANSTMQKLTRMVVAP